MRFVVSVPIFTKTGAGDSVRVIRVAAAIASAASLSTAELANLEHYWSYGRSEAVYPSRTQSSSNL